MIKDLNALIERAKVVVNDKNTGIAIREAVANLFDFKATWIPEERHWVDLGLPSGNLWYDCNGEVNGKEYFNHDDALESFGEYLPSATAMAELYENCEWEWTGGGYKVIGPNGKYIMLPARGRKECESRDYGYYWTRCISKTSQTSARHLYFDSGDVYPLSSSYRGYGFSVRPFREY